MIIQDLIDCLEEFAPPSYKESFDNVGLLIGDAKNKLNKTLITLDVTENVLEEAIEKNCNLIVSFHPIIFSDLKKIIGANYVEKIVIKAIQNNIAIYAIHTNLDNVANGVNYKISEVLQLQNTNILSPQKSIIKKLTTYVPNKNANIVRKALFEAGAGQIGNYEKCSFNVEGKGSFLGNENSNPVVGSRGELREENETCITVTFLKHLEKKVLKTLFISHPYEEIAYEIITLDNVYQNIGMGMLGELSEPMDEISFLKYLKKTMKTDCIRHTKLLNKKVHKVAVVGGSGSFALEDAKRQGADVFVSADFKYHQFFSAENQILIADIGHYESEQFTKNLIIDFIKEKMPKFAVVLSKINTNPINYI